jgi:hypothetical protein
MAAPNASFAPNMTPNRSVADETLREYDERTNPNRPIPTQADIALPSSQAVPVEALTGLERDRRAAQEEAALRGEVRGELGSPMTRMVNEPVLETLRATPVVNYLVPGYTPSSATPYAETPQGGAAGGVVFAQPGGAGATGPAEQPADAAMQSNLAALRAYYTGMRGAPSVSMNEDMRRGIAGKQEAIRSVIGAMEAEGPGKEAARAGLQAEGAKYLQGLQGLQAQQNQDFAARRQQMAADEAALAQAREQFDPARTLREIGKSPVSTGALTFAAGLVGMLKGSAGQVGPNEILQEVDKAVERDTKAQMQRYDMLVQGIQTGRSNFGDLMKMGASQQDALGLTALASMDQHRRALEFAEQRITGAKEKGALKQAISELDFQRGKLKMDLDLKNAANWVAMNRARGEGLMKVMELEQRMKGMDPESRKAAQQAFQSITGNERFDNAKEAAEAVGRVRQSMMNIPVGDQKRLWDTNVRTILNRALETQAAQSSTDGNVILGAVASALGAGIKSTMTPEEVNMLNLAQQLVNTELRRISGGSVTTGEAARNFLSRNFSSYDGFKQWIDTEEQKALGGLSKYEVAAAGDPTLKSMMDTVLIPAKMPIMSYKAHASGQEKVASGNL